MPETQITIVHNFNSISIIALKAWKTFMQWNINFNPLPGIDIKVFYKMHIIVHGDVQYQILILV